jgi:cytochrome P450
MASLGALSMQRDPLGYFQNLQRRYGDVFTLPFGTACKRTSWVCSPALAQQILEAPADQLEGGLSNRIIEPLVGASSLLTLAGEAHAERRALLKPEFDRLHLDVDRSIIEAAALAELRTWRAGEVIPLWRRLRMLTMRIMLEVVFGIGSGPRSEALSNALTDMVVLSGSWPMLMPRLRVNLGPISPWGRFIHHRERANELLRREIVTRRADPQVEQRTDILSLAVTARYPDGGTLGDNDVRDELMTLVIAGNQTTAGGLAWAIELLLRNPGELAQVRDQLRNGSDEYLQAAIKEALRLRMPLFGIGRQAMVDYRLGAYTIPRGTAVAIPMLLVHRSPELYKDPTIFRPARQLCPARQLDNGARPVPWVPFGDGIRSCIGAQFAPLEISVLLQAILEHTELELVDQRPERMVLKAGALVVPDREVRLLVNAQHVPAASASSPLVPGSR